MTEELLFDLDDVCCQTPVEGDDVESPDAGGRFADGLAWYTAQIRKYPVPTEKEERELLSRAFHGDVRAREELVLRSLRLVLPFARKIFSRRRLFSLSFEDLIQAGNLGLMDAVLKFDPERFATRFSTYAVWHIENRINETIAWEDRLIRFPVYIGKRMGKYFSAISAYSRELGRNPTAAEIAAKLGISLDDVRELEALSFGVMSIDAPIEDAGDDVILSDIVPSDEISHEERRLWSEAAPMVETALRCLDPDDREILCGLVGTHAERKLPAVIAKERGIPQREVTKRGYAAKTKVRLRLEWRGIRKRHFL